MVVLRHPSRAAFAFTLVAATCGALMSGPGVTTAVAAGGNASDISADAEQLAQVPLVAAANDLMRLTDTGAAPGMGGYAGVALTAADTGVTLYWHGALPSEVQTRLDRLRKQVAVTVIAAPHTWQQLQNRTKQIADHMADLSARGLFLSRVGPKPDGTAVVLGVNTGTSATARSAMTQMSSTEQASAQAVLDQVTPSTVPVEIVIAGANNATGTRDFDNSPWWGGSRIVRPGNERCSTAFSVANNTALFMLTAGHCGGISTVWDPGDFFGNAIPPMGTEINRDSAHDTALIRVSANQPFIYDKGWSSALAERVIGTQSAVPGQSVCNQGATTGTRCGIKIYYTGQTINFGSFTASNEVYGVALGGEANAGGDSGGPVIGNSATPGSVWAMGIVSGADSSPPITCQNGDPGTPGGDPGMSPQPCYDNLYFEDINTTLQHWQVHLR